MRDCMCETVMSQSLYSGEELLLRENLFGGRVSVFGGGVIVCRVCVPQAAVVLSSSQFPWYCPLHSIVLFTVSSAGRRYRLLSMCATSSRD